MYGSTAKAISHYKDIENFWESVNLQKLLCGNFVSLRHIARFRVQSQWAMTVWIASGEKKFRLFLFFYCWLSKVVKIMGLLCRKVTLKCFCYVTLGLAACSVDLWGVVRWWLWQRLARQHSRLWFVIRLRWLWGGLLVPWIRRIEILTNFEVYYSRVIENYYIWIEL